MASKKKPTKAAPAKPAPAKKPAAKAPPPPNNFDDAEDDQLVDASGTFRAVSAISQAQVGHGEDSTRFPNESLVMRAQRDGFVEDGPTPGDAADDNVVDEEVVNSAKRERLKTLAALDAQRRNKRR